MILTNEDKISTVWLAITVILLLAAGVANADFVFGEPVHLGPTLNTYQSWQGEPSVSADGLSLYFVSARPGGSGDSDIWVTTRATKDAPWNTPVNLGPVVNSSTMDRSPSVTADGLELYFCSRRTGTWQLYVSTRLSEDQEWGAPTSLPPNVSLGYGFEGTYVSPNGLELYFASGDQTGSYDLCRATRTKRADPWGTAERLGSNVNGAGNQNSPCVSSDGLVLFYWSGGKLWMATRPSDSDSWGPSVDTVSRGFDASSWDFAPSISNDGSILYFESDRPGSIGGADIWQASLLPIVDFNGDGKVSGPDVLTLADCWETDDSLCDIGPMPWGDGIVDVEDLRVLAEYIGQEVVDPTVAAHWALDEADGIVAHDSVADSHGIVMGTPAWQPTDGQVNGALQLDGVDDYISTPFVLNPDDGPFSVFAWIKGGTPGQVIFSQTGGSAGLGSTWLGTNTAEGGLMTSLMFPQPALVSGSIITDGLWHRIGLVWDGSRRSLYVDELEVASDALGVWAIPSDGSLNIGCGPDMTPGTFWEGLIDDVRIYDRAVRP